MADKRLKKLTFHQSEERDCDIDHIERNSEEKLAQWSRKILRSSLAFADFDIFRSDRRQVDNIAISSPIKTPTSWLRRCWKVMSQPICIYLISKSVAIVILRMRMNSSGALMGSRSSACARQLRRLIGLIGDPFCSLAQLTPIAYLGHSTMLLVLYCIIPYHYRHFNPFEFAVGRFLLDPKREIQRIDRSTCEKADFALERVKRRQKELTDQLEGSSTFHTLGERCLNWYESDEIMSNLTRLAGQSRLLERFRHLPHKLRPQTLAPTWLRYYHRNFLTVYAFCLASNFAVLSVCYAEAFRTIARDRCQQRTAELAHHSPHLRLSNQTAPIDCRYSSLFSKPEIVFLVEIILSLDVLVVVGASFNNTMIALLIRSQLDQTDCIKESLTVLLAELHQLSHELHQTHVLNSYTKTLNSLHSTMYKNIIGLWTYEVESRRNVAEISRLMGFYMAIAFSLSAVLFASFMPSFSASSVGCGAKVSVTPQSTNLLDGRESAVVITIWFLVWMNLTIVMSMCSAIPSRVMRMKRLVVSIEAQVTQITNKEQLPPPRRSEKRTGMKRSSNVGAEDMNAKDPLLSLWRKIVLSRDFASEDHSVNVLNFKLTYRSALEINLYVAALISLLNARW